jgi:hypothetical protein
MMETATSFWTKYKAFFEPDDCTIRKDTHDTHIFYETAERMTNGAAMSCSISAHHPDELLERLACQCASWDLSKIGNYIYWKTVLFLVVIFI